MIIYWITKIEQRFIVVVILYIIVYFYILLLFIIYILLLIRIILMNYSSNIQVTLIIKFLIIVQNWAIKFRVIIY